MIEIKTKNKQKNDPDVFKFEDLLHKFVVQHRKPVPNICKLK